MKGGGETRAATETDADPSKRAEALEKEISQSREKIGRIAGELDRRRHALFDIRRHALPLGIAVAAVTALAASWTAVAVLGRRRRVTIRSRFGRWRAAFRRVSENPERVARPAPGVGRTIAAAGGGAAAAVLAKELVRRLMHARR